MKTMLKLVEIGHAHSSDCCWAHNLGYATHLFIKYDICVVLQAVVFCRLAEVIVEDRLEKCHGGRYREGEKNRKLEKDEELKWKAKWKNKKIWKKSAYRIR